MKVPPLLKLDGQGNNRGPDSEITLWLCWIFAALLLALLLFR